MQFVDNGPEIPDALLQAHDEGRVVFFCGAGISYPAGLPDFKGLVKEIYRIVGTTRTTIEQEAYTRSQYDATLDLLERRLPGQRFTVRSALKKALQPKLRRKGATDTHTALLQLARSHDGALRLVTTNFDRVFERVAKQTKQTINAYSAPMLPIPKNSRWDGLVYLHGLLPDKPDTSALQRLVLTSGDFGLAYLTERWAARFVSELFRNYVVCFVGYSINDPVLRYMMDALAADRMLGEVTPQAYALGDYEPGQEDGKIIEWEAKGVTPILYEVPSGGRGHSALHRTLKAWAGTYRDGILGKERIVIDHALVHPSASSRQDDFVGRMLWALSHESGIPAKRFADFNPAPTLDWLKYFSEDRYQQGDLSRFGIPANTEEDKLRFSLIRRPAPYTRASWMSLASQGSTDSQWDRVMLHLARWLVRHLNDPELIVWLAERGGQLHDRWSWLIEQELERFDRLEQEGKTDELEEIRTNAPNAIPSPQIKVLWRLLLTGRVKSPWRDLDLYRWKDRLKRDGLTTTLRLELRDLLAPKVKLKKRFIWRDEGQVANELKHLREIVDWELELTADHVHSTLQGSESERWNDSLPALLDDFQQLLRDALDLFSELGDADDHSDPSNWDLPSISPHWQNRSFHEWSTLIELLRDAWLSIYVTNQERAEQIAQTWFDIPYSTFKRLALFAASHSGCIPGDQWVDWLSRKEGWWLWSVQTKRETMRLLVLQSANTSSDKIAELERVILAGPPKAMYKNDIDPGQWQLLVDRSVWLYLAKLQDGVGKLGAEAQRKFNNLTAINPDWKLASNESDEFSHWMSGSDDPDFEESRVIDIAPRKRHELVKWLKQAPPTRGFFHEDTWRDTCRSRFYHSFFALNDLAQEDHWPEGRWREALQAWSEEGKVRRSWCYAAPLVQSMPDDVMLEIASSLTWWLETASKSIDRHETILLELCRRLLMLTYQDSVETDQPVSKAINHPVGHITQTLLNLWFKREPNDNDNLPQSIEPFFTQLCDTEVVQFRHGRVILASRLIALYRVDRQWTEQHLLPLFDWAIHPIEAQKVWEGFLWSPRLYRPLMLAFKLQFLQTAHHYSELGEHSRQFATFLTFVALDQVEGYTEEDFRTAIGALPKEGLTDAAQALSQALMGAGEQREDYWCNRVQPFWQRIWPKSRDLTSNSITEALARLSIAARGEFPAALSAVSNWLKPIEYPHHVVHLLNESGLIVRFPAEALSFLYAVIESQPWAPRELGQCLRTISEAAPDLEQDHRYEQLVQYALRHDL